MLKAGEYSPNNPLIRGERPSGDALLGLGEYERRRNTLRKLRQQQYREYLDQQAKKKQEEKEKAERERREREQREREQEERERERELERTERDRVSPERPRAYTNTVFSGTQTVTSKVDTGVQTTNTVGRPLSVAVQTDDAELYRLSSPPACPLTRAERELSPRTVAPRRSLPELEHTLMGRSERYKPSLLDADAVQQRNAQAEKEAATKRQFYQQELKNQILEQQRIREERKAREKLLEAAEMRRLEEQLRMLRGARDRDLANQCVTEHQMKENATDYEKKRTALQKEIDYEQHSLFRAPRLHTSHSDGLPSKLPKPSKLPFYYPSVHKLSKPDTQPYSTNIPDTSIFSPNYDVDSYLRKNLNPSKEMLSSRLDTANSECLASKYLDRYDRDRYNRYSNKEDTKRFNAYTSDKQDNNLSKKKVVVEALVHERPKYPKENLDRPKAHLKENDNPIPVLRHSPVSVKAVEKNTDLSEAMQVVDDKWKVPAVQKNILKNLPNEEGKSVSILTQLGSIRRQLQLEQLKLDKMLTKE